MKDLIKNTFLEFMPFYSVFYGFTKRGKEEVEKQNLSKLVLKRIPNIFISSLLSIAFLNFVGFDDYINKDNLYLKYKTEVIKYFGGENNFLDNREEMTKMYEFLGVKQGEKIPFEAWEKAYKKFVKKL